MGRTDRQTDGRTGRTGVTLNALPLFFEYAGHKNKKDIHIKPPDLTL